MNRSKYLAFAASLILGATGFALAQQTHSNSHSMHQSHGMMHHAGMMTCSACPGMQDDATGTAASQSGKDISAQPSQAQTKYSQNPYWEPKDWNYIESNTGN